MTPTIGPLQVPRDKMTPLTILNAIVRGIIYLAVPVGDSDHWAITGTARQNDPLQQYYMLLLGGSFYLAVPVSDSDHWAIRRQTGSSAAAHRRIIQKPTVG